ncbi:MAG: RNA ligase [Candidatus Paceibacterota bacterium]
MKMLEKIDWKVLCTYVENSLIIANKHPELDIWILNYSPKVQSKKFWDEYTLSCRGLVIDAEGNILARPFEKFMNYEEYDPSEIDWSKDFDVFEKMDGSLIIIFYYEPRMKWIVASRGSFISEQALEAQKMITVTDYGKLDIEYTYLFEAIYPENRIVVNYGNRRELVLLTKINTNTGAEINNDELVNKYSKHFTVVKKFQLKSFDELKQLIKNGEDNSEGFVIRFSDGLRLKMKFAEYCRLHAILTNVSNLTVWEHLINNYDFDALYDRVPDEFYNWLKRTIKAIQSEFNEIERKALKEFIRIYYVNGITVRKDFAMEAIKTEYQSILFKLYDKRSYDEIIWKLVRPVYSKPFRDGFEYSI